jgi:hypothetical protein
MKDRKLCAGASNCFKSRKILPESEEFASANVVEVFVRNNTAFSTKKKYFAFMDYSHARIRRGVYCSRLPQAILRNLTRFILI